MTCVLHLVRHCREKVGESNGATTTDCTIKTAEILLRMTASAGTMNEMSFAAMIEITIIIIAATAATLMEGIPQGTMKTTDVAMRREEMTEV